jgi:glutamine amidotransferase
MFAMAASHATSVRDLLHDAPRSLRVLSEEHADGWGIALRTADDWTVHRSTTCAARCTRYANLDIAATLVLAHVRKRTVGELTLSNTHPFRRGRYVFAHNGTVEELGALTARTSPEQLAAVQGTTDSERFFAFILTHIDEAGEIERGVRDAVASLRALGDVGSTSFLLSDGERIYAHRCGRTLFRADRHDTALVASEPLTIGDTWAELPERALVALG